MNRFYDPFGCEGGDSGTGMSVPPVSRRERKSQICSCGSWHCSSRVLRDLQDRTEKSYWANPPPFPMVWRTLTDERVLEDPTNVDEQEEEDFDAGTSENPKLGLVEWVDVDSSCSNDEQGIMVIPPSGDEEIQKMEDSDNEGGAPITSLGLIEDNSVVDVPSTTGIMTMPPNDEKIQEMEDSEGEGDAPMTSLGLIEDNSVVDVPSTTGLMTMSPNDEKIQEMEDSEGEGDAPMTSLGLIEDNSVVDVPSTTGLMTMSPNDEKIQEMEDSEGEGDAPMTSLGLIEDNSVVDVPSTTGIMAMPPEDEKILEMKDSKVEVELKTPDLADKDISVMDVLNEQVLTPHQKKTFKCTECGRSFRRAYHLTHHMSTHRVSEKFRCIVCDKMYGSNSALKTHQHKNGFCSKELKKIQKGPAPKKKTVFIVI